MSTGWPRALRRIALSAIAGCLGLLTLQPSVQGQAQRSPLASSGSKIRILSVSTPPLAGKGLPDGGLIPALVRASLDQAEPGAGPEIQIRWSEEGEFTQKDLSNPSIELFLPVESVDCDRPNELAQASAVICDRAVYSEPIFQVVLGLFTLADSSFKFQSDDSVLGKTLCVSREQDLFTLNANGRNWVAYKRVTVLRRPTLLDCVVAVQAHDADAFVAVDLSGQYLLARLGLKPYFAMQLRPLATRSVHAVVGREHPRRSEVIDGLSRGLKRLKAGGAYAAIVQKHLSPSAIAAAVAAAPDRTGKPPARKPQAAASPQREQGGQPRAALPEPSQRPLPPAALTPATKPVLDPETRKTALRYTKRGDEELAEGRVAPARLLYERAAEMGLAQAAMALAATYDAAELDKPHLRNVLPDPAMAKRWYERARLLGAAEATARLQRLGSR